MMDDKRSISAECVWKRLRDIEKYCGDGGAMRKNE